MFRLARPVNYLKGLGKRFFGPPSLLSPAGTKHEPSTNTVFRRNYQVSIVGGTNPTAQNLALLLKENPLVSRLVLYDFSKRTNGLGLDLSHIPGRTIVEGRAGHMGYALSGSDIVVLNSGEPKRTGQTDYDLFKLNADRVVSSVQEISRHCPNAFIVTLTEPINYIVPLASRVLDANGSYNPGKLLGVTDADVMRTQACVNLLYDLPPSRALTVPVICGHSAKTMVPLLSQVKPWFDVDACAAIMITEHIRAADARVTTLKRGANQQSHLSAFAGFSTISAILKALKGQPVKHIAYVANTTYNTKFFAGPVHITKHGVTETALYKFVSSIEAAYLQDAIKELNKEIREAEEYYQETIRDKIRL